MKGRIKMKGFMRKFIVAISTVSIALTVAGASVFATMTPRSGPNDTSSVTDTVKDSDKSSSKSKSTTDAADEPASVTSQAANQAVTAKKYLTKWGGFFWFLLSVIVNFILSCWISNRFYKLAKRNTQGSAEIRALRKDIEEKFASTLTDINEPITEVVNRNENYARTDEGMTMPERKSTVEINDREREALNRWDTKRAAQKAAEDSERTYEMRRPMSVEFDDDADEEVEVSRKRDSVAKAGNKAKDFLSNIFPFDE